MIAFVGVAMIGHCLAFVDVYHRMILIVRLVGELLMGYHDVALLTS